MRLKTIKLSGFKSFVESTTIPISASLVGVVGPNGCGKSNIIDAVRWVMGEMSAKHLRGDSMADVVFNGSNARKPVAEASVELIFDNSEGRAGGQYAAYAEIAIRREAGRDGQSDYFLNKVRCRRKDITDLFLGTGLGPRAYSIIEQGMISRVIEAKPEDLRGFIEEAAGISRYKERRRETENRIRHTRENLARVEDIRRELETQLQKLQKQSKAAAKYKELKQEERLTRAQLLALRWRELDGKLQTHDRELAARQNALEAVLAQQRRIEAEIEGVRVRQTEATDAFNAVQAEFYAAGAEISRIEQAIEHARETRAQQKREQEQLNRAYDEASEHLGADRARLAEHGAALDALAPLLTEHVGARAAAAAARVEAERAAAEWQAHWEALTTQVAEQVKQREIQGARTAQAEEQIARLENRRARLEEELAALETRRGSLSAQALRAQATHLDESLNAQERELAALEERLRDTRARREALAGTLDVSRGELSGCEARLTSLKELQAAAERRDDAALREWLERHRLSDAPRLAETLSVEPGWEKAVERVLGADLTALCVTETQGFDGLAAPERTSVTLIDVAARPAERASTGGAALLDKLATNIDLAPLLAGVSVAGSLGEAIAARATLGAHESLVTREGDWVGRNWLRLGSENGQAAGLLARRQEIERLAAQAEELRTRLVADQERLAQTSAEVTGLETRREELGRGLNEAHRVRAGARERLGHHEAQHAELTERAARAAQEHAELEGQMRVDRAALEEARRLAAQAEAGLPSLEARRAELGGRRAPLTAEVERTRQAESDAREALHRLEIEREARQAARAATHAGIERLEGQLKNLIERRGQLVLLLADDRHPEIELKHKLDGFLQTRLEIETRLAAAREALSGLDTLLRGREQARAQEDKQAQALREELEAERVARQEVMVRRDTFAEQLREAGAAAEEVVRDLAPEATEAEWVVRLEALGARIERLGPINLVAIEEFEEASSRKNYLDKQSEDLSQALATLEEAIRKIDRETRTRFKETFDKVNENFQGFFPQLFGGGSAHLETTDNDLLETGVTVMARPPGKRNSTIHLLSGGEKALTAVALLFSIFQLNPAPFCLLDEVDAPLDDANVLRYCETLKEMAKRTQLVYVTHNKISMEMAEILLGVTMTEPGVSRLVAVDVDEAMKMVAR